jgi:AcrR family transcriptional regulator
MATDRRTLLIRAASELFGGRAYDEVTTAGIARRAGVSYGLLAHHFTNKRGIYLATIHAAADRIRAMQDAPRGDTPMERLRDAISRHIRYADDNAPGYLALMRGGSGSDPEVRAVIDDLRAGAARRILAAIGAADPAPPVLRATMRGWTGYLDELVIDHLDHDDVPHDHLVELATAALVTALRTAVGLDPHTGLTPAAIDALTR